MSLLHDLWRILNSACEESARLSSAAQDRPLRLTDRLALWGHLLVCASCRRFRRQLHLLRQLSPGIAEETRLTTAAKQRIHDALRKAQGRPE